MNNHIEVRYRGNCLLHTSYSWCTPHMAFMNLNCLRKKRQKSSHSNTHLDRLSCVRCNGHSCSVRVGVMTSIGELSARSTAPFLDRSIIFFDAVQKLATGLMCALSRSQTSETSSFCLSSHQINWSMQKVSFRRQTSIEHTLQRSQILDFKAAVIATFQFHGRGIKWSWQPFTNEPQAILDNDIHLSTPSQFISRPSCLLLPGFPSWSRLNGQRIKRVPRGLGNREPRFGGLLSTHCWSWYTVNATCASYTGNHIVKQAQQTIIWWFCWTTRSTYTINPNWEVLPVEI